MSDPKSQPFLSRAGAKPGTMGLTGSAGLQLKPVKKFGLQMPKKQGPSAAVSKPAVFGDLDDDLEDDASERARVSRELQRGTSSVGRAAVQATQAAALAEDANVFDYDGVYDSMQQDRAAVREKQKPAADRSARYIGGILSAHKVREMENEKLFERKLVKEAEAEAHLYGDKEKFMTSAYRKKLEAREEYEAELKRQEVEEQRNDVTKRGDLTQFYSSLLHNTLAPEKQPAEAPAGSTLPTTDALAAAAARGSQAATAAGDEEATGGAAAPQHAIPPSSGGSSSAGADGSGGGLVPEDLASAIASATSVRGSKGHAKPAAAPAPAPAVNHERRNDADAVLSARERYLARKRQRTGMP